MLPDPCLNLRSGHGATDSCLFFPLLIQHQGWNATYAFRRRRIGMILGINFGKNHPRHTLGRLRKLRSHHAAWTAPWRPEIHHQRQLRCAHIRLEIAVTQINGFAIKQGCLTTAALNGHFGPPDGVGSQAVLRAACVANDLHRDSSFHEQLTTTDRNLHEGFHLFFIN